MSLESLVTERRLVTPNDLIRVRQFILDSDSNFGTAVMFLGILSGTELAKCLASQNIQSLQGSLGSMPPSVRAILSIDKCKALQVIPLNIVEESGSPVLVLGMTDPLEVSSILRVEEWTRMKVQPVFVALDQLQKLYQRYYRTGLDLFPPEPSALREEVSKRRVETLSSTKLPQSTPASVPEDKKFQALLSLLIKKGLITADEFKKELCFFT